MNVVVIYESLTGNTRRAAEVMVEEFRARGVNATACPTTRVDLEALSAADLVIVGSWTDGIIITAQRPGRAGRLRTLPVMNGKRALVYLTYAIDAGKALDKLTKIVAARGAEVLGGMTIRRDRLEEGARELVDGALSALAT